MRCYTTMMGDYYEGDRIHALDLEVPQRPDADYVWDGFAWRADSTKVAERERQAAIDEAIRQDNVIQQIKAMTNAEYDAWWTANVTNAAQAIGVLKRVVRVLCRKVS